jgi:NAD(P)H-dependent flavin oxidoreductase YrpB (nitropropane dioxygenase family)
VSENNSRVDNASTLNTFNGKLPTIIQGGMGIAVSSAHMAKIVSQTGNLGVVSGTAIDSVFIRRLQDGDKLSSANADREDAEFINGSIMRALQYFPDQSVVNEILDRYYIEDGKNQFTSYIDAPKLSINPQDIATKLLILSNFVEVFLAKEGHGGLVGINLLEKIQMATPASIYGAMLAGVDYILMGACIPADIPALITNLLAGNKVKFPIRVEDSTHPHFLDFDPSIITNVDFTKLKRPTFLAIVSSHILANYLSRDPSTRPDGFVIEGPTAGGHNAPPRSKENIAPDGQIFFTDKDLADIEKVKSLGYPFWLAGGYSNPEQLTHALSLGATGIQVGTLFALARESGFTNDLRNKLIKKLSEDTLTVRTEPKTSATGFPFKVVEITGTMTDPKEYADRNRICDLGYLRSPFQREDGGVGYRCTAEPLKTFTFKGGNIEDTLNVKCLCNALMSNIGEAQIRVGHYVEPPLITLGSDLDGARHLLQLHPAGWGALDVVSYLTGL